MTQDSSSEEDFTLTHPEQVVIQLQSSDLTQEKVVGDFHHLIHFNSVLNVNSFNYRKLSHHEFRGLFAIHEGARNSIRSQDLISGGGI